MVESGQQGLYRGWGGREGVLVLYRSEAGDHWWQAGQRPWQMAVGQKPLCAASTRFYRDTTTDMANLQKHST